VRQSSDSILAQEKIIIPSTRLLRTTFLLATLLLAGCEVKPELEYTLVLTTPPEAEAGEAVRAAALSSDGLYAAFTLVDGSASVWNVSQRKEIRNWPTEQFGGGAEFLEFTGGGKLLLMAGVDHSVEESELSDGDMNYIMIWNIANGTTDRVWTMQGARLTAVSPSEDGSKIVAGFSNGLMIVFDDKTASRSDYALHTGNITDIQISRDGRYALSGSVDGNAHYWSLANGEILRTFTHRNRVTNVAANSDFSLGFTSDSLDSQRLWNLQTGDLVTSLQHQQRWMYISNVHFSQAGDHLLVASPSSAVSIWKTLDGSNVARWNSDLPVVDVAQSKPGNLVSVGSTGIVEVWKTKW